jgi:hypothetical protein
MFCYIHTTQNRKDTERIGEENEHIIRILEWWWWAHKYLAPDNNKSAARVVKETPSLPPKFNFSAAYLLWSRWLQSFDNQRCILWAFIIFRQNELAQLWNFIAKDAHWKRPIIFLHSSKYKQKTSEFIFTYKDYAILYQLHNSYIKESLAKLRFFCECIWNFVMMKMKQLGLPYECIWSFVMMKMKQQCSVYLWWSNLDPNSDLVPAKKNSQIYKQTSDEPELLHSSKRWAP